MSGQFGVAEFACAVGGNFTGTALIGHDHEVIPCLGHFGQPLDFNRDGRSCCLDTAAIFIQHGTNTAISLTCQNHIASLQGTGLHQHGRHGPTAFVQPGLNDQAFGHRLDRSLQLQHFGLKQNLLQQFVDTLPRFGRNRYERRIATKFFGHYLFHHQLVFDALGVGIGFVNLVDGNHNRHARRFRVLDGLFGLGHHAVVRSHHQNHNVSGLGTTGTHGRESLVTGGIEERHHATRSFHMVGTDVLRDAASLTRGHFGTADVIQQRCFAVVNVPHDRDHRGTGQGLTDL